MSDQITVGKINIVLTRKNVKNLSIRILPPDGSVRVTAPLRLSEGKVLDFIRSKENWIRKQQARMADRDYEKPKQFVSGEEHYLFGKKYILELRESKQEEGVALTDNIIKLFCRQPDNIGRKEELMDKWYRENLIENIPSLISKWEERMNVKVLEFRVRKMSTRWGTCNPGAGRIWISLMLAKRRPELLEYIVVHEMVHLLEHGHNKRFYNYMDSFLPAWKKLRAELK